MPTAPDIVFIALGSPKQENLIQQIRSLLPKAWWLGVGISFSFLSGDVTRAPRWMQRLGIEWLHRLAQDPKRLFHRYVVVGVPFGTNMLLQAAIRGLPRRFGRSAAPTTNYNSMGNLAASPIAVVANSGGTVIVKQSPSAVAPRRGRPATAHGC